LLPQLFYLELPFIHTWATPQDATPAHASGQKNSARAADKAQARAKEIYSVDCAICHGETGDGKTNLPRICN